MANGTFSSFSKGAGSKLKQQQAMAAPNRAPSPAGSLQQQQLRTAARAARPRAFNKGGKVKGGQTRDYSK